MSWKKPIQRGEKVGLKLTRAERALLLEGGVFVHEGVQQALRDTPPTKPVPITLEDLDDLAGHVAGEVIHTKDGALENRLERNYRKIEGLLDTYTYEAESAAGGTIHFVHPPVGNEPTILPMPSRSGKGSEQYPLKLTDKQREALVHSTRLRRGLKNRIDLSPVGTHIIGFTKKELDEVTEEVQISLAYVPGPYKKQLVAVRDNLDDILDALEEDEATKYPRCVDGERACPPEDVGGLLGYGDFLEAIADPKHENHESMKEWIGDRFDPEGFSGEEVNRELRALS